MFLRVMFEFLVPLPAKLADILCNPGFWLFRNVTIQAESPESLPITDFRAPKVVMYGLHLVFIDVLGYQPVSPKQSKAFLRLVDILAESGWKRRG